MVIATDVNFKTSVNTTRVNNQTSAKPFVFIKHPLADKKLNMVDQDLLQELEWQGILSIDLAKLEAGFRKLSPTVRYYAEGLLSTRKALSILMGQQIKSPLNTQRVEAITLCLHTFEDSIRMLSTNANPFQQTHAFAAAEVACMTLMHLEPTTGRQCHRVLFGR